MDLTKLAGYAALGALINSAIIGALRQDNTIIAGAVPTRIRVAVSLALGLLQVVLMQLAGTPLSDAAVVSLLSTSTAIVSSAAPRATVALLGLWFALNTTACAELTPKRVNAVEHRVECVLEHRSLPPEQVALLCAIESPSDVVDIITGEDRRIGSARAIGESQGRMLGCAPAKR